MKSLLTKSNVWLVCDLNLFLEDKMAGGCRDCSRYTEAGVAGALLLIPRLIWTILACWNIGLFQKNVHSVVINFFCIKRQQTENLPIRRVHRLTLNYPGIP